MITGPGTHDRSPPLRLLSSTSASSLVILCSFLATGQDPSLSGTPYSPTSCRPRQPRPTWPRSHSLTVMTQPLTETSDLCALAHRDQGPMKAVYVVTTPLKPKLGLRSYVDQLVCTSGGCSGRHGRRDVGTSRGGCPRSTTGPRLQRLCIEQVFERGVRQGWKWGGCRYEIGPKY